MDINQVILILIVSASLLAVAANRLRMDIAALFLAAALGIFQIFGFQMLGPANSPENALKAISGFSQPVIVTLIALFILTRGLEKSGVTRWLAQQILKFGGSSESKLILLFATFTGLLSLFMNNLAAGALVLPSAIEVSRKTGIRPSKLLIPVAYGSLLGGSATYFTTANIIMSDMLRIAHPPQAPLKILDFTPTGGLIAIGGIIFLWLTGSRLLPNREPSIKRSPFHWTTGELESLYQIGERLWEARVSDQSPLIRKSLKDSGIGEKYGVVVAAIRRDFRSLLLPDLDQIILKRDILFLVGREEKIEFLKPLGLEISPGTQTGQSAFNKLSFLEIVLSPHSKVVGKTLKDLNFRHTFGLTVIAVKHLSRSYRTDVGDIPLAIGDSLLAIGELEKYPAIQYSSDFIVLKPDPGDQPVNKRQALATILLVAGAIAASVGGVPVYLAMLSAAVLLLILRILPVDDAYQSIEWSAVFMIAGMYTVSLAMVQTGLAGVLGTAMIGLLKNLGPIWVPGGSYILTALLTQVMGGQVTALVTGPITISAALNIGVNPQAVAVATAIGCSASFFTPMAHPVNILMIGPANYKFSDFLRAGWILTFLSFFLLMFGMILFWKL